MQTVLYVIRDNGDGSQSVDWYRNCTESDLREACEASEDVNSYQSGDGVQITELTFPASFDLFSIKGIRWNEISELT